MPEGGYPAPSGLNSVPTKPPPGGRGSCGSLRCTDDATAGAFELVSVPPLSTPRETFARDGMPGRFKGPALTGPRQMLLRKEVIQPHLPVRLPCYDFVPIADPTFDGSLHKGWATGF